MLALSFLPLLLCSTPAHAEQHGLVVRLDTGGVTLAGPATVVLTPAGGVPTRLEVKDDGTAPDVTTGDGMWSGSVWLDGDEFAISVEVGGKTLDGGSVSWNAGDAARDLNIGVKGDSVVVEAGISGGGSGGAGVGNEAPPLGSSAPSAGTPSTGSPSMGPGGAPSGGPMGAPPMGASTSSSSDGTLYIGFGLGVLVLVGVAWLWLRNRPPEGSARPGGMSVVPEPGLLGPGTPSLSDGLSLWIVPEVDHDALVPQLLATLARHHRVLFTAPSKVVAPSVYGGPVFRATNIRPSHVGDTAESLQRDGGAVAVLFVGTQADAATLKDYADLLPTGVGSICVLATDPGVPALARVTARRDHGAWIVQSGDRTLRFTDGRNGFEEATSL